MPVRKAWRFFWDLAGVSATALRKDWADSGCVEVAPGRLCYLEMTDRGGKAKVRGGLAMLTTVPGGRTSKQCAFRNDPQLQSARKGKTPCNLLLVVYCRVRYLECARNVSKMDGQRFGAALQRREVSLPGSGVGPKDTHRIVGGYPDCS